MIYEVRTYRLKLRMVPQFLETFEKAYENGRKQLSPLAAFFYSEVGPLNEVIHIWPYENPRNARRYARRRRKPACGRQTSPT